MKTKTAGRPRLASTTRTMGWISRRRLAERRNDECNTPYETPDLAGADHGHRGGLGHHHSGGGTLRRGINTGPHRTSLRQGATARARLEIGFGFFGGRKENRAPRRQHLQHQDGPVHLWDGADALLWR